MLRLTSLLFIFTLLGEGNSCINRKNVVQAFNPRRNASSNSTPLQVGNGNFAFGVDVTGLQTFKPFGTLSTWGWHNFSLPTTPGETSVDDFTGLDWWTHDRLVNYDQPNPAEPDISNWLIQNPQRLNLGNVGFSFGEAAVDETQLDEKDQVLDMWSGNITSNFVYKGSCVTVETWAAPDSDSVGISIRSDLLSSRDLGVFFDFPYSDVNKFDAPFVGVWNATTEHSTGLKTTNKRATIAHSLGQTNYWLTVHWEGNASMSDAASGSHRYILTTLGSRELKLVASFSPYDGEAPSYDALVRGSKTWWRKYWKSGAFIDLASVDSSDALELQRRIVQSQYLMAVNSASSLPPQESGLVNNGWYGKFHLEMYFWHSMHWARWNHFDLLWRSLPKTYRNFLQSSYERARLQGYRGARWGKMTDPTGRSAPGEINSLLIWQQPHPMYFAEIEYRSFPNKATLTKWDEILSATADFMASYAFYNTSTNVYDLGPPLYPVSENTNPNSTMNPTFELAYWRFGLDVAIQWRERQGRPAPEEWTTVRDNLASLPVVDDSYAVYEGIPNMWTDNITTYDHPAMAGIYGWLPPPASGPPLNLTVVKNTADKILELWALEDSYGWDFSLLAMNSLRLGEVNQAVAYLLHPIFQFDDAGYPVGGSRVPTPYFPNGASFLLAMAMMAGGWDGSPGMHFPEGWNVKVEGFIPGL
ncbi:Six-hairpin glycosidase-like protein [Pleurostoma richardsiae]|uniref:Six-hairpin glycosidase-like protein n=1 Tax=Pleurostoma richardsiae TaxID=41990 RepID=A0AA38RA11_9PEZI|nr:Six-hairpin glycosidase-like protein [Pleurostoma richardsiae]